MNAQPFHARIEETNSSNTTVVLSIFGKEVTKVFEGRNHHDVAVPWVTAWNKIFDKEWGIIRKTNAFIVDDFANELYNLGVTQGTINQALEKVKANAEA